MNLSHEPYFVTYYGPNSKILRHCCELHETESDEREVRWAQLKEELEQSVKAYEERKRARQPRNGMHPKCLFQKESIADLNPADEQSEVFTLMKAQWHEIKEELTQRVDKLNERKRKSQQGIYI